MNTTRTIFNLSRTTNSCIKHQIILGYNGLNLCNNGFHRTVQLQYPVAKPILLPNNLQSIAINEIDCFSSQPTRGIKGPLVISQTVTNIVPVFQTESTSSTNAVNLNSSIQSNVLTPFSSKGRSIPGGQWEQRTKFDLQKSQYSFKKEGTRTYHTLTNRLQNDVVTVLSRCESTKTPEKEPELSRKDKLKRAVKEYGSTVIIFHVGISLVSLGTCYILISSGIDMEKLFLPLGVSGGAMTNAGTFVTAYAIHKVFAPLRISITLGATPFIVRYLRQIGFLKKPKVQ